MSTVQSRRPHEGQARIIDEVRRRVDAWRGFPLGTAGEPSPAAPPLYEPFHPGDRPLTATTKALLTHWFRQEPHWDHPRRGEVFKYWPHQRRCVETFIYLYEVAGIRRTEDLHELCGVEVVTPQRDPWVKLGGNLATGSGKTKMMSLIIAWGYLNAVCEGEEVLGIGRHALLIAPGLFVRDRLLIDFAPGDGSPPVFASDPVVPLELRPFWNLKVYSPSTCPRELDPEEGALVVTNYHQLLRESDEGAPLSSGIDRQMELLFESGDPSRLESVNAPLIERFRKSRGLLVLNDEAHHVWDETGHARFEKKAAERQAAGEDAKTAMAWIRSLRNLHGSTGEDGRLALQVDLSATLFEEAGAKTNAKAQTEFKTASLFRHTVVHYGLAEAITDGVVKRPVLERVEVRDKLTGAVQDLVRIGQPNAWETYKNLIVAGVERWRKVRDQMRQEGDHRKPLLFLLCADRREAAEVANYLTHGRAIAETLEEAPTGFVDPETGERLFVEVGADGVSRATVIQIHIGQKEESNEAEWDKVRASVNAIDRDQIPDPSGALDEDGWPVLIDNPYNVVVSVMMLKEGWDVRNVKVIVPLRTCDSRTLTEQTLGRGLRKMHPPILDDDGSAELRREDLFVIQHPSFAAIIENIKDLVDVRGTDEIDHPLEYVGVKPNEEESAREATDVPLSRFEGLSSVPADWRKSFELSRVKALDPKLKWREQMDETEIRTFLKAALQEGEEEGQSFSIDAAPSYHDFEHVLEVAYARPLLQELRVGFQHVPAVKAIVRQFLEQKSFALPLGLPLSFDRLVDGEHAAIGLGNLARSEVIGAVRKALGPALGEAIRAARGTYEALLSRRRSADLSGYQALKRHVLEDVKRSSFTTAAFDSADELRVARLLEKAGDVVGWLHNHRGGVGYHIEYDWHGYMSRYYPDFVVRVKVGEVVHNVILEVKGRLDDRDRRKARRGREYAELLSQHDAEPWHYLFLIESPSDDRKDVTEWERMSVKDVSEIMRRHERRPLYPTASQEGGGQIPMVDITEDVAEGDKWSTAVPVADLTVEAGGFGPEQTPAWIGWAKVRASRDLDARMFLAKVSGRSMEPGVPDGAWVLLRRFAGGVAPPTTALDNRVLVVELQGDIDPEFGGRYTLKRWKVTKLDSRGSAAEIELRPDNREFSARRYTAGEGELHAVAELVEVIG